MRGSTGAGKPSRLPEPATSTQPMSPPSATFFGLPTSNAANTPIRISGNSQPLTVCTRHDRTSYLATPCDINDLVENSLDVEWSGSVAKNAQIVLVASYPASAIGRQSLRFGELYRQSHAARGSHHERELRRVRTGQRHGRKRAVLQSLADRLHRGNRGLCGHGRLGLGQLRPGRRSGWERCPIPPKTASR